MRLVSSLSIALLAFTLGGEALARAPRLVVTSPGRYHAGLRSARGQRATVAELETTTRALLAGEDPRMAARSVGAPRTVAFRDGERIVRIPQVHRGLPVVSAGASVVFGADDQARVIAHRLADDLPEDTTPALDAAAAARAASRVAGLPVDPARAILAIWPGPEGAKLTWVASPAPALGAAYAPVVVVDALTGDPVLRFNAATSARGQVYPVNPVQSPAVEIVDLLVPSGATGLENDLVRALNCIDKHAVKDLDGTPMHVCDLLPVAAPDAAGDFLLSPAADTAPEDAFAEVQLFYHTSVAYQLFRGFSPGLKVQAGPLPAIANLRMPQGYLADPAKMANPGLPLAPFQSAFFAPVDPGSQALFGIDDGAMWFGQGPSRDYSYDGDVIYHEFTHAVVAATIRLVNHPRLDAYGVSYAPGSMNEALADYFSSAITGDPDVGEYSANDLAPGSPYMRSLSKPDACPTAIGGEPHQDATLFSGALWSVRASLSAAQASALDLAIFKAMSLAPSGDLSYEDLAELIGAEVASAMGEAVAGELAAAFTARGVLPRCTRILEYQGRPLQGPKDFFSLWFAPGTATAGTRGYAPGVVQVEDALGEGTTRVTVSFREVHLQGGLHLSQGTPFAPKLLVKFGPEPITFGESPFEAIGDVRVIDPEKEGSRYSATLGVPPGATRVSVMIGNAGEADGAYTNIAIEALEPLMPCVPVESENVVVSGGCAVSSASGEARGVGLLALGLSLSLVRRRRGRGSSRGSGRSARLLRRSPTPLVKRLVEDDAL